MWTKLQLQLTYEKFGVKKGKYGLIKPPEDIISYIFPYNQVCDALRNFHLKCRWSCMYQLLDEIFLSQKGQ